MYPPIITDEAIRTVIRELCAAGSFPSGAQVRRTLMQRFGSPAGVARLYRLLAAERARVTPPSVSVIEGQLLAQDSLNLREQLSRLREREEAHQVYWTRELGQLRQQVQGLEELIRGAASSSIPERLRAQVQAAEVRAGQLEVALRVFGPATGRKRADPE